MRFQNNIIIIFIMIVSCCVSSILFAQSDPDDIYWDRGFRPPELAKAGNHVYDMIAYKGDIIFCGQFFDRFDLLEIQNIISWDGLEYASLDTGVSFFGYSMTVYNDDLIVGGYENNGISIASWDGTSWSVLGDGILGNIEDMVVYHDSLFVAGWLAVDSNSYEWYVAVWDGSSWGRLEGSMNGKISALTVYQDKLVAVGDFSTIDFSAVNAIIRWNSSSWENFTENIGTNFIKVDLVDSNLVVVGQLENNKRVATWNETDSWTLLPNPDYLAGIDELIIYNNKITISTSYTDTLFDGAVVYFWNDTSWQSLGSKLIGQANSLAVLNDSLFASNGLKLRNQKYGWFCAKYDSEKWSIVSENGLRDGAHESLIYQDKLIVAGNYSYAGNQDATQLAAFDGICWESFGESDALNVPALFVHNDTLYVGGYFTIIGGIKSNSAAMYDGITWHDLGFDTLSQINSFAYYNNQLITCGDYLRIKDTGPTFLAYLLNDKWVPFEEQPNGAVTHLTVYKDNLIISGNFDSVGTVPAKKIALWNGTNWSAIASSFEPQYGAIIEFEIIHDTLVCSGDFSEIDNMIAPGLAFWDGNEWSTILNGEFLNQDQYIKTVTEYNDDLVIGGYFDSIGGIAANNIALWNGNSFNTLGSGIERDTTYNSWDPYARIVYELYEYQSELYVFGDFSKAGGHPSAHIARWTKHDVSTDIKDEDIINLPQKFVLNQNYPNPFNPTTEISFTLPKNCKVSLEVYNILGQRVVTLVDKNMAVGSHTVKWDASQFASGIYLYRLSTNEFVDEKKMVLIK